METLRVYATGTTVAGLVRAECVATSAPSPRPDHVVYVIAFVAVTTYATPPMEAECSLHDWDTGTTYARVPGTTVVLVATGAGVYEVPNHVRPVICMRTSPGSRSSETCSSARLVVTGAGVSAAP